LFGEQAIPIPQIAAIKHGHISVQQLQPVLASEQWDSYLRFAFVRNPFDRFVSICAFLNRNNPSFKANSLLWMKMALERPAFRERILVKPQSELLLDNNMQLGVDVVGRYEDLQASLDTILDKLDLPRVKLKVRNQSEHAHYRNYYDENLRSMVGELYASDLRQFDYSF